MTDNELGGMPVTPAMWIMGELFSHLVALQDLSKDKDMPAEINAKLIIANEFLRQAAVTAQQMVLEQAESEAE